MGSLLMQKNSLIEFLICEIANQLIIPKYGSLLSHEVLREPK